MRTIELQIEGVAPLRFNNFGAAAKKKWMEGSGVRRPPTEDELQLSAREKLFQDDQGLYFPSTWLKASLRNAGALLRVGRKSAYDWIRSVVFAEQEKVALGCKEPDGIIEVLVRRPPKKGTMQRDYFPILKTGWTASCRFIVTDESFPLSVLKEAAMIAGLRYGLGDGRPDCGRFRVLTFQEVNSHSPEK